MKRITFIIVLFLGVLGTTAVANAQSSGKAEFKFQNESHDFGKIKQNSPVTHDFTFTNTGTEPIIISEVRPSCGCSVADYAKTPIKPGETGKIAIKFDAAAVGPFTKHFTIRSNTKTPIKTLVIKGEVTQ